jgi:K+-transporting ATPase ATPase C chain
MTLFRGAFRALKLTVLLWLITVVMYTFPLLAIGDVLFPFQAQGSLLKVEGKVVGSALIGQPFASERYFWSRPSGVDYSTGKTAPTSAPSNLGPTNPDLVKRVTESAKVLRDSGLAKPAADLLYGSGSGLDPHISPAAAEQQIGRLAEARRLSPERLRQLVRQHTEGLVLGVLGQARVNVLELNLALDALAPDSAGR